MADRRVQFSGVNQVNATYLYQDYDRGYKDNSYAGNCYNSGPNMSTQVQAPVPVQPAYIPGQWADAFLNMGNGWR